MSKTPVVLITHLIGLALTVAIIVGGYFAWLEISTLNMRKLAPYIEDRHLRVVILELRMVWQVALAFIAASVIDWVWRKTLGRIGPHP